MSVQLLTKEDILSLEGKVNTLSAMVAAMASPAAAPSLYNNETLSKALGISKRTLQNYRDMGLIYYSKVEGRIFYSRENVDEFILIHSNAPFEGHEKGFSKSIKRVKHGK